MNTLHLPPGPPRMRLPGSLLWTLRSNPARFLMDMARQYGDIVYLQFRRRQIYLLNHPDFIKEVLVTQQSAFIKSQALQRARLVLGDGLLTSEGELHKRQRRLIQPAFHRQRLAAYGAVMVEAAAKMSSAWQPGETLDLHAEMMRLTMLIVARTLFGAQIEAQAQELGRSISDLVEASILLNSPFADLIRKLPLPVNRRIQNATQRLDTLITAMIAERRGASGAEDLLNLLLHTHDPENNGPAMSERQARDEALTLFLAGHETTANALTWTWYLLAGHPEVEACLQTELVHVLAGSRPTADDLERLPYTRMVFSEALRLYPPAWIIGRQAVEDVLIGGYCIPAGATVLMSQWVMHHDPRYYPNPWHFNPQRWSGAEQASRPRFAYFPFGGGGRLCIGEHFAWMEGILVLATLAQDWNIQLETNQPVAWQPSITLRPRQGLRVQLKPQMTNFKQPI